MKWNPQISSEPFYSKMTVIGRGTNASGTSISKWAHWELPKSWNGSTNGRTKDAKQPAEESEFLVLL